VEIRICEGAGIAPGGRMDAGRAHEGAEMQPLSAHRALLLLRRGPRRIAGRCGAGIRSRRG
ncbi:MAG: hypothetical protein ACK56I_37030, partial [bacterium]